MKWLPFDLCQEKNTLFIFCNITKPTRCGPLNDSRVKQFRHKLIINKKNDLYKKNNRAHAVARIK